MGAGGARDRGRRGRGGQTLIDRVREVEASGETPCFLAVDELHYGQNVATLLRIADAGGLHGLILPPSRSHPGLTRPVRAQAGRAAGRVPLLREGLMSALSSLRRAGILVVGAHEHAEQTFDEVDASGATVFVLGGEDKGLTEAVRKKCDVLVRLPLRGHVPSLNVAATAAVLVFERLRRERVAAAERPA